MKLLILAILFLFNGNINMSYSSSPTTVTKFMDQWETDQRKKGMKIDPIKCVQYAFDESLKYEENDPATSNKLKNFAWYIILTGGKWGIEEKSSQERQDELKNIVLRDIQASNPSTSKITYYELNKKFDFVLEALKPSPMYIDGKGFDIKTARILPVPVVQQIECVLDLFWDSISFNKPNNYNVKIFSRGPSSNPYDALSVNFSNIPQVNVILAKKLLERKKSYPTECDTKVYLCLDRDFETEHLKELEVYEDYFKVIGPYSGSLETISVNLEYMIDSDCFFEDILKVLYVSLSHLKSPHRLKNILIDIELALGVPKKKGKRKIDLKKILDKFSNLKEKVSQMAGTTFEILDQWDYLSSEEWEQLKQLGILRFS